ncbi:hypothetical protein ACOSP7_004050 [Xanthoceras sorbifolium]
MSTSIYHHYFFLILLFFSLSLYRQDLTSGDLSDLTQRVGCLCYSKFHYDKNNHIQETRLKFSGNMAFTWGMDLGARRHTRNDILRDICCLIAPPIYSSIYKNCRSEEHRRALLFLLSEVVSFALDLMGGSHWGFLLASFLLSAFNSLIIIYAYFIVKRLRIKLEADHKDIVVEIVFSCFQLIVSGFCLTRTLLGVNTNYSASIFPLAYAIISVLFAFKNYKGVSNSSSNASTNSPTDQLIKLEHSDQLQLCEIQVDPLDTSIDQIGDAEDTKTSQLRNICNVKPSSSHSDEVQQVPNTLRKCRNSFVHSNDQDQVDPSNTSIALIGDAEVTNPSQLSNICDVEPSDTPNKDFVPSNSHSDEVQQVLNILRKRRNTFTQSDQGEETENPESGGTGNKLEDPSNSDKEKKQIKERVAFRTKSEVEVIDDGFKWRKYGKKVVKSSPHPRNYYKCSSEGCPVKKRVERDTEDPSYVITTYEGVHNHQLVSLRSLNYTIMGHL